RTVQYARHTRPDPAKPRATDTAQASTAAKSVRPSGTHHPRLGQAWRPSFETDPSSTTYSTRFSDGLPHEIGPLGWEWPRREGSRALGERFELIGQAVDLRETTWMQEPLLGRELEARGDTILPRLGFQYEIMPDQMIGYY